LGRCTKNIYMYVWASIRIDSVIAGGQDQNSNRLGIHLMPICVCVRVCLLLKSAYLHSFRLRSSARRAFGMGSVPAKGYGGWVVRVPDLGS